MDEPTRRAWEEFVEQQSLLKKVEIKKVKQRKRENRSIHVTEDTIRPEIERMQFQNPQHIYLNQKETKKFLAAKDIFTLEKVTLRNRVLKTGEIVIISMDITILDKYSLKKEVMISRQARVVSATLCATQTTKSSGLTDLVLEKIGA